MYVGKRWYSEPEIQVLVGQLQRERDAYKKELIETLQTLSDSDTQFAYSAHLRLEELIGKSHTNIC